jgi:hypothetical protein
VQMKMGNTDVVGAVVSLRAGLSKNGSIPVSAKICTSPQNRRYLPWGPATLLLGGFRKSTAGE